MICLLGMTFGPRLGSQHGVKAKRGSSQGGGGGAGLALRDACMKLAIRSDLVDRKPLSDALAQPERRAGGAGSRERGSV